MYVLIGLYSAIEASHKRLYWIVYSLILSKEAKVLMARRKITLYCDDIPISTLTEVSNRYLYEINHVNMNKAIETGCPTFILAEKEGLWDDFPPVFKELEITPGRVDIYQKLGIEKGDTRFDRLYKTALHCDSFFKKGFWICVE